MTWQCRLVLDPPRNEQGYVILSQLAIGDMYYLDGSDEELRGRNLSDYYWQCNAWRRPLAVKLPSKDLRGYCYFSVDGKCYNQAQGYYGGWTVTGEPPNITVSPSINIGSGGPGDYHGFLQNGVIGDPL